MFDSAKGDGGGRKEEESKWIKIKKEENNAEKTKEYQVGKTTQKMSKTEILV